MIEPILAITIAISAAVMMGIATCAISMWSMNGPVLKLMAFAFLAISASILFDISANFFLGNVTTFSIIKGIGRIVEGIGVMYFFVMLPGVLKSMRQPDASAVSDPAVLTE